MNERFNTLAEQAGFYVSESRREILAPESNVTEVLREFAELLVQECCNIADEVEQADMDSYVSKFIRAHFGVEESDIDPQLRNRSTYFGNNP